MDKTYEKPVFLFFTLISRKNAERKEGDKSR
jgi:hypothetical protein